MVDVRGHHGELHEEQQEEAERILDVGHVDECVMTRTLPLKQRIQRTELQTRHAVYQHT